MGQKKTDAEDKRLRQDDQTEDKTEEGLGNESDFQGQIAALQETVEGLVLENEQLNVGLQQSKDQHMTDLGRLTAMSKIELVMPEDTETVQFREASNFCGVPGPTRKIWASSPFVVHSGEICVVPKQLVDRLMRDRPHVIYTDPDDFQPQVTQEARFDAKTGKRKLEKITVSVKQLMARKQKRGFPKVK